MLTNQLFHHLTGGFSWENMPIGSTTQEIEVQVWHRIDDYVRHFFGAHLKIKKEPGQKTHTHTTRTIHFQQYNGGEGKE